VVTCSQISRMPHTLPYSQCLRDICPHNHAPLIVPTAARELLLLSTHYFHSESVCPPTSSHISHHLTPQQQILSQAAEQEQGTARRDLAAPTVHTRCFTAPSSSTPAPYRRACARAAPEPISNGVSRQPARQDAGVAEHCGAAGSIPGAIRSLTASAAVLLWVCTPAPSLSCCCRPPPPQPSPPCCHAVIRCLCVKSCGELPLTRCCPPALYHSMQSRAPPLGPTVRPPQAPAPRPLQQLPTPPSSPPPPPPPSSSSPSSPAAQSRSARPSARPRRGWRGWGSSAGACRCLTIPLLR